MKATALILGATTLAAVLALVAPADASTLQGQTPDSMSARQDNGTDNESISPTRTYEIALTPVSPDGIGTQAWE